MKFKLMSFLNLKPLKKAIRHQEPRVKKIETCVVQTSANFLLLKIILSSLKISDINKTYINNRNRQKCELLSTLF